MVKEAGWEGAQFPGLQDGGPYPGPHGTALPGLGKETRQVVAECQPPYTGQDPTQFCGIFTHSVACRPWLSDSLLVVVTRFYIQSLIPFIPSIPTILTILSLLTIITSLGFGVLFINYRGSTGLGEENVRSLLGKVREGSCPVSLIPPHTGVRWGIMDVKDCHRAKELCLERMPHLDPEQVSQVCAGSGDPSATGGPDGRIPWWVPGDTPSGPVP